MQTPRMGAFSPLFAVFLLGGVTVACGGNKDGASEKKAPVVATKTDVTPAADDAPAEGGPAAEGSGSTGSAPATTATPAGTTGSAAAAEEEGGSGGTGGSGGSGGAEDPAEGTTGDTVDVPTLLKEIKNRKTKDARAQTALTEAEAAGAEPAAIASALNSRGEALFATPERARVFFEMANEKDPKATSPAFNLAKQAAVVGELEEAKKWLTIVHERKGKKLLKQIDFDPMWDILKDDPDVRALLK